MTQGSLILHKQAKCRCSDWYHKNQWNHSWTKMYIYRSYLFNTVIQIAVEAENNLHTWKTLQEVWIQWGIYFFKCIFLYRNFVSFSKDKVWQRTHCSDVFARQHRKWPKNRHMCRSKQIFGGAKDFCPNFPELSRKAFGQFFVRIFPPTTQIMKTFLWDHLQKEAFMWLTTRWAPIFQNQTTWAPIFSHIFRQFAQMFCFFARIFTEFCGIFRDFARIFGKSKFLGERLNPVHPRLLHHCK